MQRAAWPMALQLLAASAALLLVQSTAAREVGCRSRFGPFIEGATVDTEGNLYAVNFDRRLGSIGRVSAADGSCTSAATTPANVIGLRVLPDGSFLGAGFDGRRVVVINKNGQTKDFCADPRMVAPNDLAISRKTGYVYVSGQAWTQDTKVGDGDIWLCRKAGEAPVRLAQLGRTNGIEVSADGSYLFVSEAYNSNGNPRSNVIWRYPITADGTLRTAERALVVDFGAADGSSKVDVDGMRLDTAGQLFVTRNNGGEVVVLDPMGTNKIIRRIKLPFSSPTNLEFGGKDGKTLYVVGRCGYGTPYGQGGGCIEAIDVDSPGLYWSGLQQGLPRVKV